MGSILCMKGHVGELACCSYNIFSHPFLCVFLQSSQEIEDVVKDQLMQMDKSPCGSVCSALVLEPCRSVVDSDDHWCIVLFFSCQLAVFQKKLSKCIAEVPKDIFWQHCVLFNI